METNKLIGFIISLCTICTVIIGFWINVPDMLRYKEDGGVIIAMWIGGIVIHIALFGVIYLMMKAGGVVSAVRAKRKKK